MPTTRPADGSSCGSISARSTLIPGCANACTRSPRTSPARGVLEPAAERREAHAAQPSDVCGGAASRRAAEAQPTPATGARRSSGSVGRRVRRLLSLRADGRHDPPRALGPRRGRRADRARRRRQLRRVGSRAALRARDARARRPRVGGVVRHRAARRALRAGRHRDAAVDARQPARAVRRDLRAAEGRADRRADGDRRLDPRQRAAGARPGDRRRRPPRAGRPDALLKAPAQRHSHAAAGDGVHHRAARAVARLPRPRQPPRADDLRRRRRLPAGRLHGVGRAIPALRPGPRSGRPRRPPSLIIVRATPAPTPTPTPGRACRCRSR